MGSLKYIILLITFSIKGLKKKHFKHQNQNYIAVEDHINFYPTVNQNIELWSVVKNDEIYVRTLDYGYIINRDNQKIKKKLTMSMTKFSSMKLLSKSILKNIRKLRFIII